MSIPTAYLALFKDENGKVLWITYPRVYKAIIDGLKLPAGYPEPRGVPSTEAIYVADVDTGITEDVFAAYVEIDVVYANRYIHTLFTGEQTDNGQRGVSPYARWTDLGVPLER